MHPRVYPPTLFWLIPLTAVTLRMLPWFATFSTPADPGIAYIPVGYIPNDFLAYIAFIRQVADTGDWLWVNPFTTEPQSPRYFLGFFWLLGLICAVTGWDPFVVLEISRIPLTFIFFGVLWWFLLPIFASTRSRTVACLLVGFSGGVDGIVRAFLVLLPEAIRPLLADPLWHVLGWSTFGVLYNPLWIAALTVMLVVIRPVLAPGGPASRQQWLAVSLGLLLLWQIHPYSAITAFGITFCCPFAQFLSGHPWTASQHRLAVAWLFPAIVLTAAWVLWQRTDYAFSQISTDAFFTVNYVATIFWYPITFGVVAFAAFRSATWWRDSGAGWGPSLLCWFTVVAMIHNCPFIIGYHFLMYLHLPLALMATPFVVSMFPTRRPLMKLRAGPAIALVFILITTPLVTIESVLDARRKHLMPQHWLGVLEVLAEHPSGNVFTEPELGSLVPAYSGHRVWVGHSALTPNYDVRAEAFKSLVSTRSGSRTLARLIEEHSIRYLVIRKSQADGVLKALASRIEKRVDIGEFVVMVLPS